MEERGLEVFLPQFPVGEGKQTLQNWLDTLEPMKEYLPDSIMVGHVGGYAEKHEVEGEPNMDDFAARKFDWNKIRNSCKSFYVIHSDNDPYVPLEKAERLAKNLGVDAILVKGAGHFQEQSGYKTFDLLLEKIGEVI